MLLIGLYNTEYEPLKTGNIARRQYKINTSLTAPFDTIEKFLLQ
jgi:hypothetical protein